MKKINFKSFIPSLISILLGMTIGVIVLFVANPANGLEGMIRLFKGPFNYGFLKGMGDMFYYATPILMTGLSVGFAFQTGLFNIGASGQFIVGAFTAVYIAIKWTFIPGPLLWIVALLGAGLAGALWALPTGLFKAWRNVNEVITSIMMNYIGMYTVNYTIRNSGIYDSLRNQTLSPKVTIPTFGLENLFPNSFVNGGIVIAIIFAIITHIVLNKTIFGFEIKAVGLNRHASRYAGINEKRNIVLSMLIAGFISGVGGGLAYLASTGRHITVNNVLAAEGFNGIAVALLGLNKPIGIVLSALFISYINLGGQAMQPIGYVPEIVSMMIAIILYISALSVLFQQLLSRRKKPQGETLANNGEVKVNE
ncbi:MAG: ABC transporter permease [Erysipelothrix sp.]|nr:ABC transporter permease [Erysipelothrix sp.]